MTKVSSPQEGVIQKTAEAWKTIHGDLSRRSAEKDAEKTTLLKEVVRQLAAGSEDDVMMIEDMEEELRGKSAAVHLNIYANHLPSPELKALLRRFFSSFL